MCRTTRVALVAHALAASLASAHPEGGLLVQANGDILFTYVYPMTMPDSSKHTACLWKLDASGQLHAVLKSEHDSSSFNITMGQDGHVYVGQRNYLGERNGADEYELRLVRLDSAGRPTPVLSQVFQKVPRSASERRARRAEFNVHDFQVARDGTILFSDANRIRKRSVDGTVTDFYVGPGQADRDIGPIAWGPHDTLYVDGDVVSIITPNGAAVPFASGLLEALKKAPDHLLGGNGLMLDIFVPPGGAAYVSGLGSRRVIKLSKTATDAGRIEHVLKSQSPWAPHAVVWHNGSVFVMESSLHPSPIIRPRIRQVDSEGRVTIRYAPEAPADPR